MSNIDIINEVFEKGINNDNKNNVSDAVMETLSLLDQGTLRVAENKSGEWVVNEWAKKAILLSFRLNQNKAIDTGYTKFYDKVDSKFSHTSEEYLKDNNIRIVPQAIARRGSFIDKNVVLVANSTLLATLSTVASVWKQDDQKKNALEIADASGKLYDKFEGFVSDLVEIGKKINASQSSYQGAMNKLTDGRGNLLMQVERLKELGAKTQKQIPKKLIDRAENA